MHKIAQFNGVGTQKGELGDFTLSLYGETDINIRRHRNIHSAAQPAGELTPTPPAPPFFPVKSLPSHGSLEGGVLQETPPDKPATCSETRQGLSADLIAGLRALRGAPAPIITRPEVWGEIVSDAVNLTADGWARRALELGWDAYDLFGVGRESSGQWESLAVWLAGRTMSLIDDHQARTACGGIYYLERWGRAATAFDQPIFLWEWGRRTKAGAG